MNQKKCPHVTEKKLLNVWNYAKTKCNHTSMMLHKRRGKVYVNDQEQSILTANLP